MFGASLPMSHGDVAVAPVLSFTLHLATKFDFCGGIDTTLDNGLLRNKTYQFIVVISEVICSKHYKIMQQHQMNPH